jgi:lipopolysaccharide export system protein LptA
LLIEQFDLNPLHPMIRFLVNIFFFYPLLFLPLILTGQNQGRENETRVELIRADEMRFDRSIAPDARRLIGDVRFRHEDAIMHCDSAWQFTVDNRFNAYGNVYIQVNDSVEIFGDKLYYSGKTRIAELHGNVKMIDNQMTLTTQHLYYNLETNTANYIDGGKIVDAENTLTSIWGFYYADDKNFFFRGDVELVNPQYVMNSDTLRYNTLTEVSYFFGPTTIVSDENTIFCKNGWYDTRNDIARFSRDAWFSNGEQYLSGDSLFYDRNRGYGKAINNVLLKDSVQNTLVTGHFAEHFEKEFFSEVTRNAVLTVIAQNDSLFLHADTLRSIHDEKNDRRLLFAYHKAKFFRKDLQGLSDSIVYNFSDSTIYLYKDPVIWSENHQLTASRMEIKTAEDSRIESIHLFDAAFIVSKEDTISFNQIKGRRIVGYFRENELRRIDVFGNGEALYYVRDEDEHLIGINKSLSSDMRIYLEDNMVSRIVLFTNADANLFPPEEIPMEQRFLQHFKWITDRRPQKKDDIFVW